METDKTDDFQKEEESYNVEEIFVEDKVFEKKLLRKIDFRIMPLLTLLYLLSFLDRVSIGNAKLAHIERDLGLVGAQFNWCLSIFFFGYTLFEIPSNFILIRTNPSVCVDSFYDDIMGICNDAYVFVNNFSELMSARFFLGACEAGFFPGAIYYITTWYKRSETNSRIAIFFIGNSFAGSLSGLLAYCVVRLDGKLDLKGWQWLFLIEGLMTIVVSTLSYFFLSNYPEKTKWLSDKERKYAAGRLKNDAGKAHAEHFDKKQIYAALTDWVQSLFNNVTSCCTFSKHPWKILYAGACIVGAGLAPAIITSITWLTNNIAGHAKRAIATAMVMMCVNAGGAVASQVYRQKDYPHYLLGHSISLGFLIASTTTTIIQLIVFKTLNKKKKENPQSFLKGKTEEEIKNMGDLHPDFIYSL
ncbi:hypothetical protein RclHR1_11670003 [Rhizophagus clarus]|uniref:Major facilitator superfamily (MFS) profile domain-containing protein n=1 Tax=Rhizophagus clarus TaxID=94130 RepID=A0A2Z6QH54_9GLOM|nr:hypothetical protein RclHR1_11670003 [Rhizophagus clarus]